jgi:hypothetical protein
MDRAVASAASVSELLPPPEPASAYRVGLIGFGLSAGAAILGGAASAIWGDTPAFWDGLPSSVNTPWPVQAARLLLVALGTLFAGSAISMRAGLWRTWALAAATGLLAALIGLPDHWDSARLLARVFTALAAAGTVLAAVPTGPRYALLSVGILFHFSAILAAVTWPDPAPWLTNQVAERVYLPYLSFAYLRNAYHFYSPEPGPASLLYVLAKYELDETNPKTGKPKVVHEWIVLPKRGQHMKDPLGLTYYRRLSVTEAVSTTIPDLYTAQSFEKLDVRRRRAKAVIGIERTTEEGKTETVRMPAPADITIEPEYRQYHVPRQDITRYLLPSYAQHIAVEHSGPGRRVVSLKLYRVQHEIVSASGLARGRKPYDPVTYRPYYLGEYVPDPGEPRKWKLADPQDPMLYWLVPIVPKPGGASPTDPTQRAYVDYLSLHAGYEFDWRQR